MASCMSSANLFATECSATGPEGVYAVAAMAALIGELGHPRVCLQGDVEAGHACPPSRSARPGSSTTVNYDGRAEQVTVQTAPVASHQPNGGAERPASLLRGIAGGGGGGISSSWRSAPATWFFPARHGAYARSGMRLGPIAGS